MEKSDRNGQAYGKVVGKKWHGKGVKRKNCSANNNEKAVRSERKTEREDYEQMYDLKCKGKPNAQSFLNCFFKNNLLVVKQLSMRFRAPTK